MRKNPAADSQFAEPHCHWKGTSLAVTGVTLPRDVCYGGPEPAGIERTRELQKVMA
jgi:hypothetical protein